MSNRRFRAATSSQRRGAGESKRWLVLVIVCLARFMVVLDATVVNVALRSIQAHLGFSAANLQWVITGYTLVFGGLLLLGGRAGDLVGRRKLFLQGVAVFSFASLLNGLATSDTRLVAARTLQGLGGASAHSTYRGDVLPAVIPQVDRDGLFFVSITLIATTNVRDEDARLASGLFNTAQQWAARSASLCPDAASPVPGA